MEVLIRDKKEFVPRNLIAVRGERRKLVAWPEGAAFYYLSPDPAEDRPLPDPADGADLDAALQRWLSGSSGLPGNSTLPKRRWRRSGFSVTCSRGPELC